MQYELSSLLQLIVDEKHLAVHLVEGLPPVVSMRMKPAGSSPSASLVIVEGPELTHEDLLSVLSDVKIPVREQASRENANLNSLLAGTGIAAIPYSGANETVYPFGPRLFDVFAFQSSRAIHIEFWLRD